MSDLVEEARYAFHSESIAYKNIILRRAADEIERLRAALKEAAAKRTDCEKSSNELFLRREEAQSELNAAAAEIERLRAALRFYAEPWKYTDCHGDDVRVPDFYSELDFGETARAALATGGEDE